MTSEARSRWIGRVTVVAAVVTIGALAWSRRDAYAPLDVGRMAPDFAAADLDGDSTRLTDLRGKVVLLNVWATWCRPCLKEMPALQRLHDQLQPDGFTVLAVSVDNVAFVMGDPAEAVRTFMHDYAITFPVLLDPDKRIEDRYPIHGLPMSYLIDREGRIQGKYLGPRGWDEPEFEAEIRSLLDAES
jgi:peroxiredoxin